MEITEKMYLSAVKGRSDFRDLYRKERDKNSWMPKGSESDIRIVTDLVLGGADGKLAEITTGLSQDFKNCKDSFAIRFDSGEEFLVEITTTKLNNTL